VRADVGDGIDPLAALFAQQLASGLWEGDRADEEARVTATERALAACAARGVDSAHAVYGAQVKKAAEALCALARGPHAALADTLRLALATALRVASGRRLRAEIEAAIAALTTK
jgi:Ca-activated chloride channel family protein